MQPKDNLPAEQNEPTPERTDHEVLSQTAENPEEAAELAQMMRDIKGEPRSPLPKFVRYLGFSLAAIAFLALALMTVVLIQDVPFATRVYGPQHLAPGQEATFRIALFEPEKTRFLNNIKGKIWIMSRRHKHLLYEGKTSGKVLIANVRIPAWKPSSPTNKHQLLIKVEGPRGKESFKRPIEITTRHLPTPHYAKETSQHLWDSPDSENKPYRYKLFAKGRALVADLPNELLLQVQVSSNARPAPQLRPRQPATSRPTPARPRVTPRPSPAAPRPATPRPAPVKPAPRATTKAPMPPKTRTRPAPVRPAPTSARPSPGLKSPQAPGHRRQTATNARPAVRTPRTRPTSRPTSRPTAAKAPTAPRARAAKAAAPTLAKKAPKPPAQAQLKTTNPKPPAPTKKTARPQPRRVAPAAQTPRRAPPSAASQANAGRRAHRSRLPLLPFAPRPRPTRRAPSQPAATWHTPKEPVFVTVYDGSHRLGPYKADEFGVVRFSYMPQLFRFDWKISLEGAKGKASYQQQLKPEGYQVLMAIPRAIYPTGQSIRLRLDCLQRKGVFHIDLVQRGHRLWSTRVPFEGGKKMLTIKPPKDVRGLASLQVYTEFYYPGEIYDARLLYIGKPASATALLNTVEMHLSRRGDGMDITQLDGLKQRLPKDGQLNTWARHLFALAKARFVPPSLLYDSKLDRHKRLRSFQAKFRDQTLFSLGALGGFILLGIFGWLSWGYRRDQLAMQRAEHEHEDIEAIKTRGLPWLIGFFITLLLIFAAIIYLFWAMKWTYDNL